jgi:hypothetical protein
VCTRTVGALAHVLEAGGLATVAISLVRGQIEAVAPPRALHCDFPLGRPLGRPNDPAFQRRVIETALSLLEAASGPVLADFDDTVEPAEDSDTLVCTIPPPDHGNLHPAVDEALALRPAFNRATPGVALAVDPDQVPTLLAALVAVAEGASLAESGIADPRDAALRVRSYYDRAASALSATVTPARSTENWFFNHTEAGKVILAVRTALQHGGAERDQWFFLAPASWKIPTT